MQDHWIHDFERMLRENLTSMHRLVESDLVRIRDIVLAHGAYTFRSTKLEEIAEAIAEENTLSKIPKLLWLAAIGSGFQNSSLFVLQQGRGVPFKTRVCSSYPEKWRSRYIEKKYQYTDPVVRFASTSEVAFRFSEAKTDSAVEAKFWADAETHGIGAHGLAIPVRLQCGALIVTTFSTSGEERFADLRCDEHRSDLVAISQVSAEAFASLARGAPTSRSQLSQDELKFLHLLVTSDNPIEARSLKSSFGGAVSIEHSIREKLGVNTLLQAVAMASKNGFFDEVEFSDCDVHPLFMKLNGWEMLQGDHDAKNSISEGSDDPEDGASVSVFRHLK